MAWIKALIKYGPTLLSLIKFILDQLKDVPSERSYITKLDLKESLGRVKTEKTLKPIEDFRQRIEFKGRE